MKFIRIVLLSLITFFSMSAKSQATDERLVRVIAIPAKEHGYSNFETMVIRSQADLDRFLKQVSAQPAWNEQAKFTQALSQAKLDFDKDLLVLIRRDEGSGSVRVTLHPPSVEGKKVICKLDREVPEIGTADMAFYCYALAVTKDRATAVELQVQGAQAVTIPLSKE